MNSTIHIELQCSRIRINYLYRGDVDSGGRSKAWHQIGMDVVVGGNMGVSCHVVKTATTEHISCSDQTRPAAGRGANDVFCLTLNGSTAKPPLQ